MDPMFLLLAVFFLLAVGFFSIGIYLSTRSKRKDSSRKEKLASISLDETLLDENIHEVARILRDGQSGALMLEKNGVVYRTASDLSEEQRRLLSNAAGDLNSFLGLVVSPQVETTKPAKPQKSMTKDVSTPPLSTGFRAADAPKPPSMNPVEILTRAVSSDVSTVNLKTKSITAQIDDILQEKVANTPLEERGIRLLEASDGRVVVFVGIENYDGVDAVPDDDVRHAIRAAVTEWEKRSSQGI